MINVIKNLNNQINNKQGGGVREPMYNGNSPWNPHTYNNTDNNPKVENKENNKTEQELKEELEKEETEYNKTFSNIKDRIFDLLP